MMWLLTFRRDCSSSMHLSLATVRLTKKSRIDYSTLSLHLADCAKTYGSIITAGNVCLSGANGRSTCQGDSGGPLTIILNNRQTQIGIVSFGSESGCQRGHPTVFTRITAFHNWIQTNSGISIAWVKLKVNSWTISGRAFESALIKAQNIFQNFVFYSFSLSKIDR